jgi:hypothetical protein
LLKASLSFQQNAHGIAGRIDAFSPVSRSLRVFSKHHVDDGRVLHWLAGLAEILLFLPERRKQFRAEIRAVLEECAGGNLMLPRFTRW